MELATIMLLSLGLTAIVVALLLSGSWLLRRMLPASHMLQEKLATAQMRRIAWGVLERVELWTLILLLGSSQNSEFKAR